MPCTRPNVSIAADDPVPTGCVQAIGPVLDRLVPAGPIGLAVSGGSDSLALLHLVHRWAGARPVKVATVDHGLRPESADEAAFVARSAGALGRVHTTLGWDGWQGRGNLQAAARAGRYRELARWAQREKLVAVLLGHTLDDQAETVLLNLAYGSGADGLAAMAERRRHSGMLWLRPLLGLRRAALRAWLDSIGIAWLEDPSNADPRFKRVRVRRALGVLSGLGIDAAGLARTATRLGQQRAVLCDASDALAAHARKWGLAGEAWIDRDALAGAREDTAMRLLSDTLMQIGGATYRPRRKALEAVIRAIKAKPPVAKQTLAGCMIASFGRRLLICREPAAMAAPVPIKPPETAIWDRRWQAQPTPTFGLRGYFLGALGAEGVCIFKKEAVPDLPEWAAMPHIVRQSVPAIWHRENGCYTLAAVPALGFYPGLAPGDILVQRLSHDALVP